MPVTEPRSFHWTTWEYYELLEHGYFQDRRVELIEGEIIEVPRPSEFAFATISLTHDALRSAFGPGFWVRSQAPLHLGGDSEPEPDIAVVLGTPRSYLEHPTDALLAIEISEVTLAFDRGIKTSLYARAGIADFWIVNLLDLRVEVRRNPGVDSSRPLGFGYADLVVFDRDDHIVPLALPNARILVADFLP
jgi:Uma2 family endonuclease